MVNSALCVTSTQHLHLKVYVLKLDRELAKILMKHQVAKPHKVQFRGLNESTKVQNARLSLPTLSEDDNFNNGIHVVTTEIVEIKIGFQKTSITIDNEKVNNNAIECTVELCNVEQKIQLTKEEPS